MIVKDSGAGGDFLPPLCVSDEALGPARSGHRPRLPANDPQSRARTIGAFRSLRWKCGLIRSTTLNGGAWEYLVQAVLSRAWGPDSALGDLNGSRTLARRSSRIPFDVPVARIHLSACRKILPNRSARRGSRLEPLWKDTFPVPTVSIGSSRCRHRPRCSKSRTAWRALQREQ